jgi:hypothetical protein
MVRYGALLKAKRLLGLEMVRLDMTHGFINPLQQAVLSECKRLGLEQLIALVMFHCTQSVGGQGVCEFKDKLRMPMDRVEEVFFAYRTADQVKLKLLLGKMFTRYGINFSEVSYDFAKKVAPHVYEHALAQVKDGRVQMQPCELTLLPIKHCRWCGMVQNDKLRLCEECRADRGFSFRTWFCGDECERLAMDLLHREEHVRHLLIAVGIEKLGTRAELETAASNIGDKRKKKKSGKAKK